MNDQKKEWQFNSHYYYVFFFFAMISFVTIWQHHSVLFGVMLMKAQMCLV
jgi:hypothetical protein